MPNFWLYPKNKPFYEIWAVHFGPNQIFKEGDYYRLIEPIAVEVEVNLTARLGSDLNNPFPGYQDKYHEISPFPPLWLTRYLKSIQALRDPKTTKRSINSETKTRRVQLPPKTC